MVEIVDFGMNYRRTQLVRSVLPWRYAGVLHEYLICPRAKAGGLLAITMRRGHDGRRRRDPATYRNDAAVLVRALEDEADPSLVACYTLYVGQSIRDAGDRERSIAAYLRRADLGYWDHQIFVALLQATGLLEALGHNFEKVLAIYGRATQASPGRAEAAHNAARLCRFKGLHVWGYAIATRSSAPLDIFAHQIST